MRAKRIVFKFRYGGMYGRQKPDRIGRRYRVRQVRRADSCCALYIVPGTFVEVLVAYPGAQRWEHWSYVDSYAAAYDRIAYYRSRRS